MREIVIAAVALVLGAVLGGVLPREQVRDLKAQVAQLSDRDCRPKLGQQLAGMLVKPRPTPKSKKWEPVITAPPEKPDEAAPAPAPAPEPPAPSSDTGSSAAPGTQGIEQAKEALALRRTQARAALLQDADPDAQQLKQFDGAVADMNADLRTLAQQMVDKSQRDGPLSRRDTMQFASDALDVLITADDRMNGALTPDQVASVDDASVDPFSYVDPSILDLFAELDQ